METFQIFWRVNSHIVARTCSDATRFAGGEHEVVLKVVMGQVTDYFKPRPGTTFCEMILGGTVHGTQFMWSNDLITWRIPFYQPASTYASGYKGGSDVNWPRDNVPGDSRSYLSFWGPGASSTGACCCDTYSNTQASDGAASQTKPTEGPRQTGENNQEC